MRVRQFELRLVAVALAALWAGAACLVLVAYRPGGPFDVVVGLAASLPLLVSLPAVVWPPLVRSRNGAMAVFWLGLVAGVLLVPSLIAVANQVLRDDSQTLLPSIEVVYPWALALLATALFAGLGVTRRVTGETSLGRRRFALSAAFSLVVSIVVGGAFTGASLADEAALRDRPIVHSRFGPTGASPDPPDCAASIRAGTTARVDATYGLTIDGASRGTIQLKGVRSGSDVSWTGDLVTPDRYSVLGVVRAGGASWERRPGADWTREPGPLADDELLDATVTEFALSPADRQTAEERGLEFVEGARARHCRISLDAATFVQSFPQVRWLVGSAGPDQWHGTVDYWVFEDGEVGMVTGSLNGSGSDLPAGTQAPGVLGTLEVSLTATERDEPVTISAPR